MSALEIAIGVTSAFWLGACAALMVYADRVYAAFIVVGTAAMLVTVWFVARLWGFA
jgi:hypothetical protein